MITVHNSFYKDYESLLIKNDELSKENRNLKYLQKLAENQIKNLIASEEKSKEDKQKLEDTIKEKDYEIARLKALLNIDGTNHGIPTSMTPIHKKKVIPNTREKREKIKGKRKIKGKKKMKISNKKYLIN